jgi:hypothetical protein
MNIRFRCPVCNNGIRHQGLKWQLQFKIVTKDPNRRWQLHHGIEKMSEIKKWILWRDRPPPKRINKKRETANGVRAGYTGASATPGFTAPQCEREERESHTPYTPSALRPQRYLVETHCITGGLVGRLVETTNAACGRR